MAFYESGKVYVGKPCKKCANKVRYSNSRRCVECKNSLNKGDWQRRKVLERHNAE